MAATKKILIVDDEPFLSTTLAMILKNAGYQANVAANAHEARQLLKSDGYHLVVLDLNMPGISGMDFLPEIRHYYPNLPVVVLTGYGSPESRGESERLGVRDYLNKPIEPSRMLDRIRLLFQSNHLLPSMGNSPTLT